MAAQQKELSQTISEASFREFSSSANNPKAYDGFPGERYDRYD
jgi:hypothetical protein